MRELHIAAAEVGIFEVHVVALLDEFDDLAEAVHVELADEGLKVAVAEEVGQHFVLEPLGLLDQNLGVPVPSQVLAELLLLRPSLRTSRMW